MASVPNFHNREFHFEKIPTDETTWPNLGLQNLCHSDKEKKSGIKAGNTFPHLQLCA